MPTRRPAARCVATLLGLVLAAPAALGQAGSPDFRDPSPPSTTPPPRRPEPGGDRPPSGGNTVDLRPKFKKGTELRYVLEQDAVNRLKARGGGGGGGGEGVDQDQKLDQRLGLVMRVIDSGDTGATIQVVYESIRVKMTTAQGTGEYDSAKGKTAPKGTPTTTPGVTPGGTRPGQPAKPTQPAKPNKPNQPGKPTQPADPNDPLANLPTMPAGLPTGLPAGGSGDGDLDEAIEQMVAPMVGQTVTVKTDATGNIVSVSGGEGLGGGMGGMGGGMSLLPPPSSIANWLVAGTAGAKSEARVGETWTNDDSLAGTPIGNFRMVTKHTLQSAMGGVANVKFSGHIEKASEGTPMGLAQVRDSRYNGSYQWDSRAGALREMATELGVTMDASFGGTPVEMNSQSKVRVTRQDRPGGFGPRD